MIGTAMWAPPLNSGSDLMRRSMTMLVVTGCGEERQSHVGQSHVR